VKTTKLGTPSAGSPRLGQRDLLSKRGKLGNVYAIGGGFKDSPLAGSMLDNGIFDLTDVVVERPTAAAVDASATPVAAAAVAPESIGGGVGDTGSSPGSGDGDGAGGGSDSSDSGDGDGDAGDSDAGF
jgi:hypothetical protein